MNILLPAPESPDVWFERAQREIDARKEMAWEIAVKSGDKPVVLVNDAGDRGALIHPSTKYPGKYQVTWWDTKGFSGDTCLDTLEAAVLHAIVDGYKNVNQELFRRISRTRKFVAYPEARNRYASFYWSKEPIIPSGPVIQLQPTL